MFRNYLWFLIWLVLGLNFSFLFVFSSTHTFVWCVWAARCTDRKYFLKINIRSLLGNTSLHRSICCFFCDWAFHISITSQCFIKKDYDTQSTPNYDQHIRCIVIQFSTSVDLVNGPSLGCILLYIVFLVWESIYANVSTQSSIIWQKHMPHFYPHMIYYGIQERVFMCAYCKWMFHFSFLCGKSRDSIIDLRDSSTIHVKSCVLFFHIIYQKNVWKFGYIGSWYDVQVICLIKDLRNMWMSGLAHLLA